MFSAICQIVRVVYPQEIYKPKSNSITNEGLANALKDKQKYQNDVVVSASLVTNAAIELGRVMFNFVKAQRCLAMHNDHMQEKAMEAQQLAAIQHQQREAEAELERIKAKKRAFKNQRRDQQHVRTFDPFSVGNTTNSNATRIFINNNLTNSKLFRMFISSNRSKSERLPLCRSKR